MQGTCPRCGWTDGLTVPEAAKRLGVSDQTVRNYIKGGRLPGTETEAYATNGGTRFVIPIATIETFEKQRDEAVA